MKKYLFIVITTCLAMLATSCVDIHLGRGGKKLAPSDSLVDKVYDMTAFDQLEMDIVANVKWIQGDANDYRVVLRCPENYVDLFNIRVDDGELKLDFAERNVSIEAGNTKLLVYAPTLRKVENKGVAAFKADSATVERIEIENEGVGNMKLSQLKAQHVDAECSGVGGIELSGTADEAKLDCSGVGSINASGLQATAVKAEVSGVGNVSCWATERINGEVSGVGSLSYRGTPKDKQLRRTGVGKISSAE